MAESHHITADTVQVGMPFPKLMCCFDEPTYPEMAVMGKEIYQSLATILLLFSTGHASGDLLIFFYAFLA